MQKRIGLKGTDIVTKYLYYTCFKDVYCLPVQHLLLRGVLRDMVECLMNKKNKLLTASAEKVIIERGERLRYTRELRDKYKCIIRCYK